MKHAAVLGIAVLLVAACDDEVGYSANTTVGEVDSGTTGEGVDAQVEDTAALDTGDLPDTPDGPEEVGVADAGGGSETCSMTFINAEQGEPLVECAIDVRDMIACDTLARCVCTWAVEEAGRSGTVEGCVEGLVMPRGSISLADYCALSGEPPSHTMATLVNAAVGAFGGGLLPVERPVEVEGSPECAKVAAFSLWGLEPSWALTSAREGAEIPGGEWELAAVADALEDAPLLTLEDVAWLAASEGWVELTPEARMRVGGRLGVEPMSWVRRGFVVHGATRIAERGMFWSLVLSSTASGVVVLVEDVIERGAVRFQEGHPPSGPRTYGLLYPVIASQRRQVDALCVSTCGCPDGHVCEGGVCRSSAGCGSDAHCCVGVCEQGACR